MADPQCYAKPGFIVASKTRLAEIDNALAEAYGRWEELAERPQ
jgi:hypothetical protein